MSSTVLSTANQRDMQGQAITREAQSLSQSLPHKARIPLAPRWVHSTDMGTEPFKALPNRTPHGTTAHYHDALTLKIGIIP